jgi:hypothetical protein
MADDAWVRAAKVTAPTKRATFINSRISVLPVG